jgi:hypothetical protein
MPLASFLQEQRRKRNRESAAASRQRQKDRIIELEKEVDQWKSKYEVIMQEIQLLENKSQASFHLVPEGNVDALVPDETLSHATETRLETSTPIPMLAPSSIDIISSTAAPVSPTQVVGSLLDLDGTEEVLLPYKMISRPAATRINHFDGYHVVGFLSLTA